MWLYVLQVLDVCSFRGGIPRNGIAGSHDHSSFDFLKNDQAVAGQHATLEFHCWCTEVPISLHLAGICFFSILKAKLCQGLWTAYSLCSECVSFVMNSVEHLYVSSLTIWMSSLAKHLFSPLPICKLWFLYGSRLNIFFACMCLLYVRAHVCWSQRTTCRRGFSPPTRGVLEVKLRCSGLGASARWVISPAPGSRFSNVSWARVSVVRFANLFSWNVCCLFIPVFLVLALRFRFLIHLELIFINGMR